MKSRTIYNPVVKDKVTFLKTSEETNGELTLIEIELAPKGGNTYHYHDKFTETFEVIEGQLEVFLEKERMILKKGESTTVPLMVNHFFRNPTKEPIKCHVAIKPGSQNFEQFLQIMYGLASDGLTNKKGIPKNPLHIAIISLLGETHPPKNSLLARIGFLFKWLERRAIKKGIDRELIEKYVL